MTRIPTTGEYRVGIDFNPSGDNNVNQLKAAAAGLIDMIQKLPSGDPTSIQSEEIARCKALACTYVETAAMFAVKAATKRPPAAED